MNIFLDLLQRCYKRVFWKYAAALEESTYILMFSRTSAWIFSHKLAAHLKIKLFQDCHGMGTVSENITRQKTIRS